MATRRALTSGGNSRRGSTQFFPNLFCTLLPYNRGTGKYTPLANIQFAADWSDLSNSGPRANQWGLYICWGCTVYFPVPRSYWREGKVGGCSWQDAVRSVVCFFSSLVGQLVCYCFLFSFHLPFLPLSCSGLPVLEYRLGWARFSLLGAGFMARLGSNGRFFYAHPV